LESVIRLQIEKATYDEFLTLWQQGAFDHQRLGQAFYNHFRLHRLSDQGLLHELYAADGSKALNAIAGIFQIN
jgi:hypothetical protein